MPGGDVNAVERQRSAVPLDVVVALVGAIGRDAAAAVVKSVSRLTISADAQSNAADVDVMVGRRLGARA